MGGGSVAVTLKNTMRQGPQTKAQSWKRFIWIPMNLVHLYV